jgi:hypothetical protein
VPATDEEQILAALRDVAAGRLEDSFAPRGLERFTYPAPAEAVAELVEEAIARRSG